MLQSATINALNFFFKPPENKKFTQLGCLYAIHCGFRYAQPRRVLANPRTKFRVIAPPLDFHALRMSPDSIDTTLGRLMGQGMLSWERYGNYGVIWAYQKEIPLNLHLGSNPVYFTRECDAQALVDFLMSLDAYYHSHVWQYRG